MPSLDEIASRSRQRATWASNLSLPSQAWNGATIGVIVTSVIICLTYFAFTVLAHFSIEKLPAFFVWFLFSAGGGLLALFAIVGIMQLPPFYRWSLAACLPLMLIALRSLPDQTQYMGLALLVLVSSLVGGSASVLLQRPGVLARRLSQLALGLSVLVVVVVGYAIFSEKEPANPELADYELADWTLELPNPGQPGQFAFRELSYGSGVDRHRPEYGEQADFIARRVDGSRLVDNWDGLAGRLRTSYWGFGPDEMPLQARVWMPEGEGPFPLVLVVHGNHGMEDYSDPGYDYLGEHFASRGVILASVDENFINGSYTARVEFFAQRSGLREENDARGWLLLEHLAQWRDWNSDPGHPLFGTVDMERLALIGHSRGGEAVGVAAAFNELAHYPDDASVEFDYDFNLRGVIAIAPVYGQYEARERPTVVEDVNYFTIHGNMDGDVQSFEGIGQYSRVRFSGDAYRFRSSLYVVGANHGQFNTTWENLDTSPFYAWALNTGGIMPREAQRDVARVYFTAFLEAVFYDRLEYLPLFRDARYGAAWLPRTFYINQFADSDEQILVDFEQDLDLLTLDRDGGTVATRHLSRWFEAANELKFDELDSYSLFAAWDSEVHSQTASISFDLGEPAAVETLVLSLSSAGISSKPAQWESAEQVNNDSSPEDSNTSQDSDSPLLDWTVVMRDANDNVASAPLSADSPLYPLVKAVPDRADFLDDTDKTELLFRRFELPRAAFTGGENFDFGSVRNIEFVFDRSDSGAIALDYIATAR